MKKLYMAAVLAVLAIALAACGSSSNKSTSNAASPSGGSTQPASNGGYAGGGYGGGTSASGVKVGLGSVSFGKVLVGPNQHTVYMFLKDTGPNSHCNGKCAVAWAPLTTSGKPQAGSGVKQSLLATSKRSDGSTQVTYAGHPLYYYDDDKKPGMTEGEGKKEFGAEWYAVGSDGKKVEKSGS